MHGRKKTIISESDRIAQATKASTYLTLVHLVIAKRNAKDYSMEALALTSKMIKANPDFYTLWNYRREILIHLYGEALGLSNDLTNPSIDVNSSDNVSGNFSGNGADNVDGDCQWKKISSELGNTIRDNELEISAEGIKKNSKSYGAWYHRQWIVNRFVVDRESELNLCKLFLEADQRNFHCWAYRRYVTSATFDSSPHDLESKELRIAQEEFGFSTEKISDNFSNYSSFHHRSVFIRQLTTPCEELMRVELDIVENAIFTEPYDQSAWWYLQFLLTWAEESASVNGTNQWLVETLETVVTLIRNLLELEAECKWALTCLVSLFDRLNKVKCDTNFGSERTEMLQKLIVIDPMHKRRYEYLLNAAN